MRFSARPLSLPLSLPLPLSLGKNRKQRRSSVLPLSHTSKRPQHRGPPESVERNVGSRRLVRRAGDPPASRRGQQGPEDDERQRDAVPKGARRRHELPGARRRPSGWRGQEGCRRRRRPRRRRERGRRSRGGLGRRLGGVPGRPPEEERREDLGEGPGGEDVALDDAAGQPPAFGFTKEEAERERGG